VRSPSTRHNVRVRSAVLRAGCKGVRVTSSFNPRLSQAPEYYQDSKFDNISKPRAGSTTALLMHASRSRGHPRCNVSINLCSTRSDVTITDRSEDHCVRRPKSPEGDENKNVGRTRTAVKHIDCHGRVSKLGPESIFTLLLLQTFGVSISQIVWQKTSLTSRHKQARTVLRQSNGVTGTENSHLISR
jgi:hypothetical protein